ncbi:MAG TPA: hypothetical protein DCM86_05835 [Verrucomicrobiales bacterium]|nr:hypothetical protein [Verrucomicrobiales bacterium]
MPFAFKLLQAKNVNATSDTLYKVGTTKDPNAVSAIVSNVRIYNKGASSATISLIVQSSAGAPTVFAKGLVIGASSQYIFNTSELALNKDALISITTSASPNLDCVLCGVERLP